MQMNTNFDFRSDTPPGTDPDTHSPTLRRYHKLLWSRLLPDGTPFPLEYGIGRLPYLIHKSSLGEFVLSSDSVVPSFRTNRLVAEFRKDCTPEELEAFHRVGYTIGGMMVFPGKKVEGKMTINGARGLNHKIKDRFDLTLECIRRYYQGKPSPLGDVFERYAAFFRLFGGFDGYVDFFHLQDFVASDYASINFMMPFKDFDSSPLPGSTYQYISYMRAATDMIEARNRRIGAWASSQG